MAWNLDPTNELLLHLVDFVGVRATTQYWIGPGETNPGGGAASAIAAATQGISNSFVESVEILRRASNDAPGTPTDGPYPRAADKVLLEFTSADGSVTKMEIPAPNETILSSDKINVNPADAALSAFVNYVLTNCVDSEGSALLALAKGYRRRPPRLKKQ